MADDTAGDPVRAEVRWTNLSVPAIAARLAAAGHAVGRRAVSRLLRRHEYRARRLSEDRVMGRRPNRDEQFRNIAALRAAYLAAGDPVVSVDTKRRELVGGFHRPGTVRATGPVRVYDHDFPSFASGVVVPHDVYDVARNKGHLTPGTSRDTTAFACDSLRLWWARHGRPDYPDARRLLVVCDGGGSNSATKHLWKQDLQAFADEVGAEVRVAHYPPYCSKYDPIEHRMFPHVTRACAGVVFDAVETARRFMAHASTSTGLSVTVDVLDRVYAAGRRAAADCKRTTRIAFDDHLPKWNYRAVPAN